MTLYRIRPKAHFRSLYPRKYFLLSTAAKIAKLVSVSILAFPHDNVVTQEEACAAGGQSLAKGMGAHRSGQWS